MTELLISLFTNNPWLLYFVVFIFIIIVALLAFGVIQGREVSIYPPRIGPKISKMEQSADSEQPPQAAQTIHQTPITQSQQQNQILNIYPSFTPEQIEQVATRVAERVQTIRRETGNKPPRLLYLPPSLPERLDYIYSARHEIEKKVRNLVLSHGGGWAGHSMASFDIYLEYAQVGGIITTGLVSEINDFYFMFTQPMINFEDFPDEQFLEIQFLAAHINRQLDAIPLGEREE